MALIAAPLDIYGELLGHRRTPIVSVSRVSSRSSSSVRRQLNGAAGKEIGRADLSPLPQAATAFITCRQSPSISDSGCGRHRPQRAHSTIAVSIFLSLIDPPLSE